MLYLEKVEYLCLFLQVEGVDFFELTFLITVSP